MQSYPAAEALQQHFDSEHDVAQPPEDIPSPDVPTVVTFAITIKHLMEEAQLPENT